MSFFPPHPASYTPTGQLSFQAAKQKQPHTPLHTVLLPTLPSNHETQHGNPLHADLTNTQHSAHCLLQQDGMAFLYNLLQFSFNMRNLSFLIYKWRLRGRPFGSGNGWHSSNMFLKILPSRKDKTEWYKGMLHKLNINKIISPVQLDTRSELAYT